MFSQAAPKRASVSRRSLTGTGGALGSAASPGGHPRARSAERNVPEPDDAAVEHPDLRRLAIRCDSDPLDAAGTDDDGLETLPTLPVTSEHGTVTLPNKLGLDLHPPTNLEPIPTLPRYPIAETKNCSCWSEPPHDRFQVRGRDYLREKPSTSYMSTMKRSASGKVTSGPYLFRAIGCDVILTNASSGPGTALASNYTTILGGHLRKLPTFIINFVCPWGLIVNYYEIPEFYLPYLRANEASRAQLKASVKSLKPHERAMARFLLGTKDDRDATLKLIPHAVEGPLVVKKMVQGRPAIIGKRLPTTYTYYPPDEARGHMDCFEVDLDVNKTDSVGTTACTMSRRYMGSLTVDLGFVIEGRTEEEVSLFCEEKRMQ